MNTSIEAGADDLSEHHLMRSERNRVAADIGEKLYEGFFGEMSDEIPLVEAIPHWSDEDGGENYRKLMDCLADARERQIASMALNALRFAAEKQKHVYPNIEDAPYPSIQIVGDVAGYDFEGIGIQGIKKTGGIILNRAFRRLSNEDLAFPF